MRPAGIKEVAEAAGVSVGTVSNVLNRPAQVAPATRLRVERVMAELGFVRNSSASALKAGRSRSLGLVVLDIGNPFFTDMARGVEQVAAERGYAVLLCNSDESRDRQDTHLTFLEEQRVGGVLITPVLGGLPRLDALHARGTPVVLLDEPGHDQRCSVAVDDVRGGELAGEHLLAQGRRELVYVTGPPSLRQCVDRGAGLERAVRRSTLDVSLSRFEIPSLNGVEGYRAASGVIADGPPDGIFCANDVVALGVLRGLLEAGLSVPDDVALIGYDDIEFAATAAVPLSSVRQPAVQIGRTAAALLLEEIAEPEPHAHQQVLFRPELVVRRSTSSSR
ncbi:MAG: LacI family DNA-binding transcriptional regulator [Mycobacteriales bacterium]